MEAHLLSKCCHANLPWLCGIVTDKSFKLIVMNFHGKDGQSVSLHHVLHSQPSHSLTLEQTKVDILGIISGLRYLHEKSISHNDVKSHNIAI